MSNEFKHSTAGPKLEQDEFEDTQLHTFDSQATGDLLYASSSTQLTKLAIGTNGDLLTISSGVPAWSSTVTTAKIFNDSITLANNKAYKIYNSSGVARNVLLLNSLDNLFIPCVDGHADYIARIEDGYTGTVEVGLFGGASGGNSVTAELFIDSDAPTATAQLQDSPHIKLRAGVWNSGFAGDGTDYLHFEQYISAETAGATTAREGKTILKFGNYSTEAEFINFEMNAGPSYVLNLSQDINIASGKALTFLSASNAYILAKLPTSDPGVVGQWYSDGGTVKISAG